MDFFGVLVGCEVALWNAIDAELRRRDQIGLGTLHALRTVSRYAGRARVQELSSDIGITVGAASKMVDRLERDGLVTRTPNPANRRSSLVALTADGRHALASASRVYRRAISTAVGDEDLESVTATLQRLRSRLGGSASGVAA